MSTLEGMTMHPRCRHIGAYWDLATRMISALWHKSKFNLKLFWKKKIKFSCFHGVVLVKTFPLMHQLLMYDWYWRSQGDFFSRGTDTRGTDKIQFCQFQTFLKKLKKKKCIQCCSTREDFSIDVSITNVGLILTKLRWFQLFSTSQNSNFKLFGKKSNFWVSMV